MRFKLMLVCLTLICMSHQAHSTAAQNFTLQDIQTNQPIRLSDFHGKVVYLDFWASWCSSCAKALPLFNQWHQTLDEDFVVVSVNVDEAKQDGLLMAQKFQLDFPIGYDEDLAVAKIYQASALPVSFIINKNGQIHYQHLGFQDGDATKLKSIIEALLTR